MIVMMSEMKVQMAFAAGMLLLAGCEYVDHTGEIGYPVDIVAIDSVARMLSSLPLEKEHLQEVHEAVSSSSGNGYDEEYTMRDLFESPGAGVGDDEEVKSMRTRAYDRPLRELIREHLCATRADGGTSSGEEYLQRLMTSDVQIYWPYSGNWDGETMPVITFDPENGAEANIGYRIVETAEGARRCEEVEVDEELAENTPVWVVNRNDDSRFTSLEMLRKKDPEWGNGGGSIVVGAPAETRSSDVRTLVLKDFMMRRNYDSWFAGASEFFIKCGKVEDFKASTEAELKLYSPQISDFMVVVRRNQVLKRLPFDVVLVSQWTEQNESIAFMMTEDDGGTRTEWKCSAVVKYNSKSYGFEISLPFNTRDDIVWRGQLAGPYLEKYDGKTSRFGDVELTFQFQ
ncbi:MAG: hypothetical protein ACI3ZP_00915 [Candidatus Cryptobacteroides sp.]